MDQYLLIPFLGGWTSILTQLFWCELQGDRVLTHPHIERYEYRYNTIYFFLSLSLYIYVSI